MMKWREGVGTRVGRSASRRQLFGVLFSPLPQAKQHNPHITRVRTLTIDIARRAAPFISLLLAYHTHTTHTGQPSLSTRHLRTTPRPPGCLFQHHAVTNPTQIPPSPPPPPLPHLIQLLGIPPTRAAPSTVNHKARRRLLLPLYYDLPSRRRNLPRLLGRSQSHDGRPTSHPPLAAPTHPRRPATQRMHHFGERQTTRHLDSSRNSRLCRPRPHSPSSGRRPLHYTRSPSQSIEFGCVS